MLQSFETTAAARSEREKRRVEGNHSRIETLEDYLTHIEGINFFLEDVKSQE